MEMSLEERTYHVTGREILTDEESEKSLIEYMDRENPGQSFEVVEITRDSINGITDGLPPGLNRICFTFVKMMWEMNV